MKIIKNESRAVGRIVDSTSTMVSWSREISCVAFIRRSIHALVTTADRERRASCEQDPVSLVRLWI